MATSVVLNGAGDDATVIETAMRFAAKEGCLLRVFVGMHGDAELIEQQLDFARWFLQTHGSLAAPRCSIERRPVRIEPACELTGGDPWL
jgi:hypothetical protein